MELVTSRGTCELGRSVGPSQMHDVKPLDNEPLFVTTYPNHVKECIDSNRSFKNMQWWWDCRIGSDSHGFELFPAYSLAHMVCFSLYYSQDLL